MYLGMMPRQIQGSIPLEIYLSRAGAIARVLIITSRTGTISVFDAASISSTSIALAAAISTHDEHSLQGSAVGPFMQLRALANSLAVVVLPTPRAPEKR